MSNNEIVSSRALPMSRIPIIKKDATLKKALDVMTELRLGIVVIVDDDNKLIGVLTDGDLRRLLLTRQNPLPALLVTPALEFGNTTPKFISADTTVEKAREIMFNSEIWDLPLVTNDGTLIGLVHRHLLN
jgi:arabinose-5-phosphate isomerase